MSYPGMIGALLTPATVIDLAAVPWGMVLIILGVSVTLLEARLVKGGFVKKDSLDGLGTRLGARMDTSDKERAASDRMLLVARADLDDTRDRVTRMEMMHEAMAARINEHVVKPLSRIEDKIDKIANQSYQQEAEIDALKESVRRLEGERPTGAR